MCERKGDLGYCCLKRIPYMMRVVINGLSYQKGPFITNDEENDFIYSTNNLNVNVNDRSYTMCLCSGLTRNL
jgi:hypothetical protein